MDENVVIRIFENDDIIIYKRLFDLTNCCGDKRYFEVNKHTEQTTGKQFKSITQVNKHCIKFDIEQKLITSTIKYLIERYETGYNIPPDLINKGECDSFAEDLQDRLKELGIKSEILSDGLFTEKDGMEWDITKYGNKPTNFDTIGLPSHYWIYYNGKHYDSETSQGVKDMFKLPIIENYYTKELS